MASPDARSTLVVVPSVSANSAESPLDAQSQFLTQVHGLVPLTEVEEARLVSASTNDQAARDRLVEGYQLLVLGVAYRFQRRCQFLDLLDLAQEGTIGLLHAIEAQYKRAAAMPFKAWALAWIRSATLQSMYQSERIIRLPLRTLKRLRRLLTAQTRLLSGLGREPTMAELAMALACSEREVLDLLLIQAQHFTSLEQTAPSTSDGSKDALEDMLSDPGESDTYTGLADVSTSTLHRFLRDMVELLPERERRIITLRYGFDGDEAKTALHVATLLGIPLETVQNIERRVLYRFKVAIEHAHLAPRDYGERRMRTTLA
jgi:RNA polymerase sigma factor (sigma-70 family)